MTVRLRFAPSPTGHLHIGGARTALFCWLYARRHQGKFILRIEDTDTERSTAEYIDSILTGMRWLGLNWDEGPYYQMERHDEYKKLAKQLVDEGKAYRCYCTSEELEAKRDAALKSGRKPKYDGTCRNLLNHDPDKPFVVRLKTTDEGTTVVHDQIKGRIEFHNEELDDLIILRTNQTPTYNFVVVVDDVQMKITHVVRGDDHLNNTPRQIQIYNAFNYPIPEFAHLPMILGADKKRLSKRHGATSVLAYRDEGYLPEGLLNYLVRLGWSFGDQEVFTIDDMIKSFDFSNVGTSPSVFDPDKLDWVNAEHIKKMSDEEVTKAVTPFLEKMGLPVGEPSYALRAIKSDREKGKTFKQIAELSAFYFKETIDYDPDHFEKFIKSDKGQILQIIYDGIKEIPTFTDEALKTLFEKLMSDTGLKMVKLAQPCRVALTGGIVSPGIYEVMSILGKERVINRIEKTLSRLSSV